MKCTILVMFVLMSCVSAPGALLELWFSTSSSLSPPPTPENPVLPIDYSGSVYLWARTPGAWTTINTSYEDANGTHPWSYTAWVGDVWQGISLDSVSTIGFSGLISNPSSIDPPHTPRWSLQSDSSWANGDPFNVWAAGNRGCGGAPFDAEQSLFGSLYTRLGAITISSAPAGASFYMQVGMGTIVRQMGDPANDWVQLGVGDAPVLGWQPGAISSLPDMTVASEQGPPGDLNCDGVVNNQDIDGFVLALFNPAGYLMQYPDCDILAGDFTGDGVVNNQDIDGFVAALFGG